jgi:hypothetical protein
MIDRESAIPILRQKLRKLPVGHYIELKTYKRNRTVALVREETDTFLIIEEGFQRERFRTEAGKMKKVLQTLLKREFPRSRKIRVYTMGEFREEKLRRTERKLL